MKHQVEPQHYYKVDYDTKGRFCSYWHQIQELVSLEPDTVLEIGVGNGLVCNYLKQRGFKVTTLDVDERLNPDKVGSVLTIPFPEGSFEVVACYEVLEHLPFEDFPKALKEIHRVSKLHAVLSLPDCTRAYRLNVQIPKIGDLKILVPFPRLKAPVHRFGGQHLWEIGKAGYPLRKVMDKMRRVGFEIKKTYRVFEMPYHRFFVLDKRRGE